MGCFCKCLDESDDYEKCIQISDAIMYENNKQKKKTIKLKKQDCIIYRIPAFFIYKEIS